MSKDYAPITLRNDINPWERQEPRESELQYSRFLVFRDLGPESDRLRQTLEVLNSTGDKLTYSTIKDYSSAFRWTLRASAWDRYCAAADRARMIQHRRKAIDAQRRSAEKLRAKALDALGMLNPADLSAAEVVKFLDLSHRIERSIYTEFVETRPLPPEQQGADVEDIAAWTPEERRRRWDLLQGELAARVSRAANDDEVVA
jgi:hypothetical protein